MTSGQDFLPSDVDCDSLSLLSPSFKDTEEDVLILESEKVRRDWIGREKSHRGRGKVRKGGKSTKVL